MTAKKIRDSIHGVIEVEEVAMRVVDRKEFQRLRNISQLAFAKFVYPSCTHSRFEHSLGTYHLMKLLVERFTGQDEICLLSPGEALSLRIAALCHDLGHGPFSHSWEEFIHHGGPQFKAYSHERMSFRLFQHILRSDAQLEQDLLQKGLRMDLVEALITGQISSELQAEFRQRPFVFELLSNDLNGIDVDKWDYLCRDGYSSGLAYLPVQVDRFLEHYRPTLVQLQPGPKEVHMALRSSESQ
ncbi:SAM domain and HD, partial [Cichlidogyrus casuarinus]